VGVITAGRRRLLRWHRSVSPRRRRLTYAMGVIAVTGVVLIGSLLVARGSRPATIIVSGHRLFRIRTAPCQPGASCSPAWTIGSDTWFPTDESILPSDANGPIFAADGQGTIARKIPGFESPPIRVLALYSPCGHRIGTFVPCNRPDLVISFKDPDHAFAKACQTVVAKGGDGDCTRTDALILW